MVVLEAEADTKQWYSQSLLCAVAPCFLLWGIYQYNCKFTRDLLYYRAQVGEVPRKDAFEGVQYLPPPAPRSPYVQTEGQIG